MIADIAKFLAGALMLIALYSQVQTQDAESNCRERIASCDYREGKLI